MPANARFVRLPPDGNCFYWCMATWLQANPAIATDAGFDPCKETEDLMRDCRVRANVPREGSTWAYDTKEQPHITNFLRSAGLRLKLWEIDLVAPSIFLAENAVHNPTRPASPRGYVLLVCS